MITGERNLARRLEAMAAANPDAPFCTLLRGGVTETISYGRLYARSRAYANAYEGRGVRPGAIVLIMLQHGPDLYYSFFGAVLAGAIPSFMPFPSPKQRMDLYWADHEALFARIQPALIVTYAENHAAAAAAGLGIEVSFLLEGYVADVPSPAAHAGLNAAYDDVACLQHSSGTTGLKKGVMLTHRAIDEQVEAYARAIELGDNDVIASWLPLYHDMGFITSFLMVALRGLHVIALDPFEWVMRPGTLMDAIERYRATLTWLPNFAFAHLAGATRRDQRWDLSSMRAFVNCSEPCKPRAFERFLERFANCGVTESMLAISYAMAENVFGVTQTELGQPPRLCRGVLSCGRPIPDVALEIHAAGKSVDEGTVGEIAVTSPFLFTGYYGQEEATRAKMRDGWYQTGDLGFIDRGELFVTGRIDDMLVLNGRNYYAHDLEELVSEVPACLPGRCVAISVDDAESGLQSIVLLAECSAAADRRAVGAAIKGVILERLGLALSAVVPLRAGQLIKTTSGKISRLKNKELYMAGAFDDAGESA